MRTYAAGVTGPRMWGYGGERTVKEMFLNLSQVNIQEQDDPSKKDYAYTYTFNQLNVVGWLSPNALQMRNHAAAGLTDFLNLINHFLDFLSFLIVY